MSPEEHAAMIAPRARLTAERPSILTTIRPADRIPSHGRQLTVDGTPGPTRELGRPLFGRPMAAPTAGDPLNLWDTSPDSLPETWSTPR